MKGNPRGVADRISFRTTVNIRNAACGRELAPSQMWLDLYTDSCRGTNTIQKTQSDAREDRGSWCSINPAEREYELEWRQVWGWANCKHHLIMNTTQPAFNLNHVFHHVVDEAFFPHQYAAVWTYTVKNRCYRSCNLFGSVRVAHGSTLESLTGKALESWFGLVRP